MASLVIEPFPSRLATVSLPSTRQLQALEERLAETSQRCVHLEIAKEAWTVALDRRLDEMEASTSEASGAVRKELQRAWSALDAQMLELRGEAEGWAVASDEQLQEQVTEIAGMRREAASQEARLLAGAEAAAEAAAEDAASALAELDERMDGLFKDVSKSQETAASDLEQRFEKRLVRFASDLERRFAKQLDERLETLAQQHQSTSKLDTELAKGHEEICKLSNSFKGRDASSGIAEASLTESCSILKQFVEQCRETIGAKMAQQQEQISGLVLRVSQIGSESVVAEELDPTKSRSMIAANREQIAGLVLRVAQIESESIVSEELDPVRSSVSELHDMVTSLEERLDQESLDQEKRLESLSSLSLGAVDCQMLEDRVNEAKRSTRRELHSCIHDIVATLDDKIEEKLDEKCESDSWKAVDEHLLARREQRLEVLGIDERIREAGALANAEISKVKEQVKALAQQLREELKARSSEVKEHVMSKTAEFKEEFKSKTSEFKEDFRSRTSEFKEDFKSRQGRSPGPSVSHSAGRNSRQGRSPGPPPPS